MNHEEGRKGRRSKHDNDGRIHKCAYCVKTYLSYPALYTHQKQKHSRGPGGELRAPPTSGRGRGRPRKNPYQRTDPKSEEYFNQPERKGGPTDPLLWFHELFEILLKGKYRSIEEYPLYKELVQFSMKAGDAKGPESEKKVEGKGAEENKDGASKPDKNKNWKRNYDDLSHYDKLDMLVDEIFALYLFRTSRKTNEMFYKTILAYVIFFRECLNKIGWQKRIESDEVLLEE